jgi:hypothetical protein
MTTPIRPNIGKGFKPMWNPMIQFLLIRVLREVISGVRQICGVTVSAFVLLIHLVTTLA